MSMTRTFSFAALAALAAPVALAGAPQAKHFDLDQLTTAAPAADELPDLDTRWEVRRDGEHLFFDLIVKNQEQDGVEVLSHRGAAPAPYFEAVMVSGNTQVALEYAPTDLEERAFMSRAGPRPVWSQIAPGEEKTLCSFRMLLPDGADSADVSFDVQSSASVMGGQLQLDADGLRIQQNQS